MKESGTTIGWWKFFHSSRSGKLSRSTYVNISDIRKKPIPHDPPTNEGSKVPQPQLIMVIIKHDSVNGRI